jgi:hypothetical protein
MTSAVETATSDPSSVPSAGHGRVVESRDGVIVFKPRGTNYELHLEHDGEFAGPLDKPIIGTINVRARKVYTVPSGGTFIAPIVGTPRTIQGRVVDLQGDRLILQAGAVVTVTLPAESHAIELGSGSIGVGALVNMVALPGASFSIA